MTQLLDRPLISGVEAPLSAIAFDANHCGMGIANADGRWVRVNSALCHVLACPESELLELGFLDFTSPEDFEREMTAMKRTLSGETSGYSIRKNCIPKGGTAFPVSQSVSLVRDGAGLPLHLIVRIERVDAAAESEPFRDNLLESLLATIPDHIYFKDRQSRFIRINQACGDRHGLANLEDIVGKTDFDMFDAEHAQVAFDDERRIMETGIALEDKEETLKWGDGKPCWVSSTKVPFRDGQGNIVGIIGISRNITERKLADIEQGRLQRQVVDLSRLAGMSEVAASVLHNVGNVLNSVNVSCTVLTEKVRESKVASLARTADILKEHDADLARFLSEDPKGSLLPGFLGSLAERLVSEQESMLEELALLNRNIDHIAQIINVQQRCAQIGGLREKVDIGVLVEAALQMNASMFMRHQMEIVRDFEQLPEFWADKHKILQILVNLIRNAKHALADGGVGPKCLTIRIAAAGASRVSIAVADNGIGILPENLIKIFEYGFTTKKDGHGFGLHGGSLSAQEIGGHLSVSSAGPGLGATFTLEIPMNSDSQG